MQLWAPNTPAGWDLRDARADAYAPYSDFPMGAALVTDNGQVVPGVLVENVSLGLAMCAERVAMFTAVTQQQHPVILALCSKRTEDELTFPCGACLQVALEIGGPELVIVATDPDGTAHLLVAMGEPPVD